MVKELNYQRISNENRPNYVGDYPEGIPSKDFGKGISLYPFAYDENIFSIMVVTSIPDSPHAYGFKDWSHINNDPIGMGYGIHIGHDVKMVTNMQQVEYYIKYLKKLESSIKRRSIKEIINDISKITGYPEYPNLDERLMLPEKNRIKGKLFDKYVGHKDFYSLEIQRKGFDDGNPDLYWVRNENNETKN